MPDLTPRLVAASVLKRVVEDRAFSPIMLNHALRSNELEPRDRGFVTHLVYGTLTYLGPIDAVLDVLIRDGLGSVPADLRAILRIAAYEIHYGDKAPHAAVNEAVHGTRFRLGHRFAGLANGVLRNLIRNEQERFAPRTNDPAELLSVEKGLPVWLAARLITELGVDAATDAMEALNVPSPTHFRLRHGVDEAAAMASLVEEGFSPAPHPHVAGAFQATGALATSKLHKEGKLAIQDAGAVAVLDLLPAETEGPVLDTCAGLGGKTLALLDRYPTARVISSDLHEKKVRRIPVSEAEEARHASIGWNMKKPAPEDLVSVGPFSVVVIDAPCTALGTIGRHPEARWTRTEDDIRKLAALQSTMLDHSAPLVASGGVLLYVVCTWTPEEGRDQIAAFIARTPDFELDTTHDTPASRQLWSHTDGTECFFAARLRRKE